MEDYIKENRTLQREEKNEHCRETYGTVRRGDGITPYKRMEHSSEEDGTLLRGESLWSAQLSHLNN